LARVRGIGPALTARLTPLVSLPAQHEAQPLTRTRTPVSREQSAQSAPASHREASRTATATTNLAPLAPSAVKLDLATATTGELQQIPGVGPVLAGRLVARRDSLGGFADWAVVDAVAGVGPAMLERLQQWAVLR